MQTAENLKLKEIALDKQFTYAISVTTYIPYELYINDIAAEKDYDSGSNAAIEMNPYLLGNGTHTIRLRLLPQMGKETIDVESYEMSHFELVKVIKNQNGKGLKYDEEVMKLPLPPMTTPLPFIEMKWEVEIDDLPYQLEGWSKSKAFKKEDSLVIMKQVVAYYEELRNILNIGDDKEWLERTKKRREETWSLMYKQKDKIKETLKKLKKTVTDECRNNMLPLEDYDLFFYAEGKILSLERRKTEEFEGYDANIKGWSPLIYNDDGGVYDMGIKIHMPLGSDTFEIIRK
ncbi:hypothetical protein [Aquimarina litoralis]